MQSGAKKHLLSSMSKVPLELFGSLGQWAEVRREISNMHDFLHNPTPDESWRRKSTRWFLAEKWLCYAFPERGLTMSVHFKLTAAAPHSDPKGAKRREEGWADCVVSPVHLLSPLSRWRSTPLPSLSIHSSLTILFK